MLHEKRRLHRLEQLQILDTAPDPTLNVIVNRALALLPGTSIASVSLVDAKRQWFKAIVGINAEQTPRAVSFCSHTIGHEGPMVVEDASKDPRFVNNPLVTSNTRIRFYVGIPLVDRVGALCVISSTPRKATTDELYKLSNLATYVNIQLMLHATFANLKVALCPEPEGDYPRQIEGPVATEPKV